jgi:hypothetical protein
MTLADLTNFLVAALVAGTLLGVLASLTKVRR